MLSLEVHRGGSTGRFTLAPFTETPLFHQFLALIAYDIHLFSLLSRDHMCSSLYIKSVPLLGNLFHWFICPSLIEMCVFPHCRVLWEPFWFVQSFQVIFNGVETTRLVYVQGYSQAGCTGFICTPPSEMKKEHSKHSGGFHYIYLSDTVSKQLEYLSIWGALPLLSPSRASLDPLGDLSDPMPQFCAPPMDHGNAWLWSWCNMCSYVKFKKIDT